VIRPPTVCAWLVGAALLASGCGADDEPAVDNDPRLVGIWDTGCQDANVTLLGVVRQRQEVTFTATDYSAVWEFYGGSGCVSPYVRFTESGAYRTGSLIATPPDTIALDLAQTSYTALNYPDAPTTGACSGVTLVDNVETSVAGTYCDRVQVPANGASLYGSFQFTDATEATLLFGGVDRWSQLGGSARPSDTRLPSYQRL
jgi:hypothetical protein